MSDTESHQERPDASLIAAATACFRLQPHAAPGEDAANSLQPSTNAFLLSTANMNFVRETAQKLHAEQQELRKHTTAFEEEGIGAVARAAAMEHRNSRPIRQTARMIWRDIPLRVDIYNGLISLMYKRDLNHDDEEVFRAATQAMKEYGTLWNTENGFVAEIARFDALSRRRKAEVGRSESTSL